MIDSTPRPLHRQRLERLIGGLRTRMSSSAQKLSGEAAALSQQLTDLEAEHARQIADQLADRDKQLAESTTQWDEALHGRWDDAEMRSFKAVFETAEIEANLRREAKRAIEYSTAEAKKRIAEIERRFMHSKDVPIKRLNDFRSAIGTLVEELQAVDSSADAALVQRSLRAPQVEIPTLELPHCRTADAAMQHLHACVAAARQHYHRLANHPAVKFLGSLGWWIICTAFFSLILSVVFLSGMQPLAGAVLVATGATVVLILISLVGIHPWLKRSAMAEYPRVKSQVMLGQQLYECGVKLAIDENDAELKRLAAKRDHRFEQAKQWRDKQVTEITAKLEADFQTLRNKAAQEKQLACEYLTSSLAKTDAQFQERVLSERQQAQQVLDGMKTERLSKRRHMESQLDMIQRGGNLRMQTASEKATQIVARSWRWCDAHFPAWERMEQDAELWPEPLIEPVLPLGSVAIADLLPGSSPPDTACHPGQAPLLFSPISDGYLTITGDPNSPAVARLVRNLVMRTLTTLAAGKTQICVIDPPGLGRDYGWLMHLGDFDPSLVTHRVWTQTSHIAKQIENLAHAAEDFIQQSLRNEYRNIVQYNLDAGALAEPFRLLVWSSMPSGLDEQSWRNLQSLLDSGARCGITPILVIDPALNWPVAEQREVIMRRGLHLTLNHDGCTFQTCSQTSSPLSIEVWSAPTESTSQRIVNEVGRRAMRASRVEVPLAQMLPTKAERWQADSSRCLEIPIGQSGVGRTHSLVLGVGTAQHAIIAGKTGSGKSSLLHAMLTSAILKYSPHYLRLVLLDFKKGVEFQVYADSAVPHADIIGIESHREFGLSGLAYVDACMQRRGEAFRGGGVQDIASWNALHPQQPMPRMLIVIDEFQELFVEDDKLSGQASLILDRIVRQGRSFGVHAVLSSQTLSGSYSLPRTTLGQMAVRIALQCDPSDAQIIFSEDNPAAARLKHPGQAVYNDAGGRIEGNQPMQIGWLSKQTQMEWFAELPSGYQNPDPSTNRLGRTVVYDGNRSANWSSVNANLAIAQATADINPEAFWCVVGESVAISPAVCFPLTTQTGRNVLLVGPDDQQAAAVLSAVTASFVRASRLGSKTPMIYAIQGAKPTDARALALAKQWKQFDCQLVTADVRGADALLKDVHEQLMSRIAQTDAQEPFAPLLLNLIQLGRLRSLRREEDFSSFGETAHTPDKQLEEILRDGPSHGIHCMLWADSNSTLVRWLSRAALREIEVRILMQMSANDSTNLIDTVAASRLGDHVMLVFDEATGQEQKFRPFACETLSELTAWCST